MIVPSFQFGTRNPRLKGQRRDASGVASYELVALLNEIGFESRPALADDSGVAYRIITRIFGTGNRPREQPWTALLTAERLLSAVDSEIRIHDLTIIPNTHREDAISMATFEFVDSDGEYEVLAATPDEIMARAEELIALRESMIGDELVGTRPARELQARKDKARRERREARLAVTA